MKTLKTLKAEFIRDLTTMKGQFHSHSKGEIRERLDEILVEQAKKSYIEGYSDFRKINIE